MVAQFSTLEYFDGLAEAVRIWARSVVTQLDRTSETMDPADAALTIVSACNVESHVTVLIREFPEQFGPAAEQLREFGNRYPNLRFLRNVLSHYDEYLGGRGRQSRELASGFEVRRRHLVLDFTFYIWADEDDIVAHDCKQLGLPVPPEHRKDPTPPELARTLSLTRLSVDVADLASVALDCADSAPWKKSPWDLQ